MSSLQEEVQKILLGSPTMDAYEAAEAVWLKQNQRIEELELEVANLTLANEEASSNAPTT